MLWIFSEVYYPEETGTAYYITQIAEHLALNQPVSVLCSQPAYSCAGVKAPYNEFKRDVRIIRCPSVFLQQKSIFIRLARMASITISMLFTALFCVRRGDSILAVTNPPSVPILAALLSFILRIRFSLLIHDIYPDIMAVCGLTTRTTVHYRLLHKINQWVLQRAERIYCIGRDMRDHLIRMRGTGSADGIHLIPLWADCEMIQNSPKESNSLLTELGLVNKMVVLYAGNMGHPHDIETLATAIKCLESDKDIHFIFIGSGQKQRILDEMLLRGSTNISVLPPRPRSEQNDFLNACDVAILSLVPGMLGLAVPSRTYNLMAASKPIIALVSESSEVARIVHEEKIGWVVEPGSVDQTVRAILEARGNRQQLREMGARARMAAEVKYSPDSTFRQFDSFIKASRELLPASLLYSSVASWNISEAKAPEP